MREARAARQYFPRPAAAEVTTRYRHPWLDRFLGRYTVSWNAGGRRFAYRVFNRLTDFEGRAAGLACARHLPRLLLTWVVHRSKPLLARPLPFLVFDAIEFLLSIMKPGWSVLEVGGGNSTLWFAERCSSVLTIETSAEWASRLRARIGPFTRVRVEVTRGRDALSFLGGLPRGSRDLLLVDSSNADLRRDEVIQAARSAVRSGGWIVLDNSDHPQNWAAADLLRGCRCTAFTGYSPMSLAVSRTSFWQV